MMLQLRRIRHISLSAPKMYFPNLAKLSYVRHNKPFFSAYEAGTNEIYKRTSTWTLNLTVQVFYLLLQTSKYKPQNFGSLFLTQKRGQRGFQQFDRQFPVGRRWWGRWQRIRTFLSWWMGSRPCPRCSPSSPPVPRCTCPRGRRSIRLRISPYSI